MRFKISDSAEMFWVLTSVMILVSGCKIIQSQSFLRSNPVRFRRAICCMKPARVMGCPGWPPNRSQVSPQSWSNTRSRSEVHSKSNSKSRNPRAKAASSASLSFSPAWPYWPPPAWAIRGGFHVSTLGGRARSAPSFAHSMVLRNWCPVKMVTYLPQGVISRRVIIGMAHKDTLQ